MIVVRYADDIVVGFQHRSDAERFWAELTERFSKFALELHPDKTRLIEFGPFAAENRRRRGQGMHRLRHRQPAIALTVVMALHHRSVEPQTRQACSGRGHPVNDSEVTDPDRQPAIALTVMMALHPHLINPNHPNHHLPRATQKSQRRF